MSLSPRFDQALQLAHALHRDQRRKGTAIPYVAHLLSVAALVITVVAFNRVVWRRVYEHVHARYRLEVA